MFINNSLCISPQDTYSGYSSEVRVLDGHFYEALEPEYRGIIPLGLLRRMSKAVRMGIATSLPLINEDKLEGIIIGSSNGSMDYSIRFLNQIIEYEEGTLTPTNFVQSTSNSIAGNIALLGKVTGYNNTHTNQGLSFEAALLDALLYFTDHPKSSLLVGGVEEISVTNYNIDSRRGLYKEHPVNSMELISSTTPGTSYGEGAAMFSVSSEKKEQSIAQVIDIDMRIETEDNSIIGWINDFIQKNNTTVEEIDSVYLGINGDSNFDHFYHSVETTLFQDNSTYTFKNLCGEFANATSFATWLVVQNMNGNPLPESCIRKGNAPSVSKNVLIYNHFEGNQHGLILLQNVTG